MAANGQDNDAGLHNPAFSADDEKAQTEFSAHYTQGAENGTGGCRVVAAAGGRQEADPGQQRAILKNVLVISLAFTFLFTAFNSMSNLQSSINKTNGTVSLTVIYVAMVVSCCFVPSLLIKLLKFKYTMALSMLAYSTYIAAQFSSSLGSLVPTGIILGLAAAPLWSAKCTYLTKVSSKYAQLTGQSEEVIMARYFGVFYLFFQSTQVWGNLISSAVLSVGVDEQNKTEEELGQCGYNFCLTVASETNNSGGGSNSTEEIIPNWQRYTMASIYLVLVLLSPLIIVLFVDPLSRFLSNKEETENKSESQLLVATFQQMCHPYQLLIIPLNMWMGMGQGFFQSDYTAAYVWCVLGVHRVGYVMICYGVCGALCSITVSPLVKVVGRTPLFTMGAVINVGVIITLIWWRPHHDDTATFFLLAGLWGGADAVWVTQINAFYGVIFPRRTEAAFSNLRLWKSLGYIISSSTSSLLCVDAKIVLLLVFIVIGMAGYFLIEIMERFGGLKKDSDGNVVPIDKLVMDVVS